MTNERVFRDARGRTIYRIVVEECRKRVYDGENRLLGYCYEDRTVDPAGRLIANGEAPGALLR